MTTNVVPLIGSKRRPAWTWADRVRKVRRDLTLTQAEFSELTGIGDKTIAAWESGRNTPDDMPTVAIRLEAATGVDRLWWIGWDGPFIDPGEQSPGVSRPTYPCLSDRRVILGPWPTLAREAVRVSTAA